MVPYNAQRQAEGLPPTQRRPAREGARPGAAGAHCGRDRPAMRQRLSLCFLLWPLLFITSCLSIPVLFFPVFLFSYLYFWSAIHRSKLGPLHLSQSTPGRVLPALPGSLVPVSWTSQGWGINHRPCQAGTSVAALRAALCTACMSTRGGGAEEGTSGLTGRAGGILS